MTERIQGSADSADEALQLVDSRYLHPSFNTRSRELGFLVLRRALGRVNYERVRFWRRHGRMPNLKAPVRFNEKVAVRKLYEHIPDAPTIVDKVAVRPYVASRVGEKYLKPIFQVTSDPAKIDFETLPEAFVAKTNHATRTNIFVPRKSYTDLEAVRNQLAEFLRKRIGRLNNEWWYNEVPPQILFEPYLDIAFDYRFWVFHGEVQFIRATNLVTDDKAYFDSRWQPQDFRFDGSGRDISRPSRLDEMIEVAQALAAEFAFIRVDLFSPGDREVTFGELTLAPGSGWTRRSEEEETIFGSLW